MAYRAYMSSEFTPKSYKPSGPLPVWEFVALVAGLMSLNALAIDTMLPALGVIAEEFNRADGNDQQLVLFAYILGFGVPQLVFGPVSDRFGRKNLLLFCLLLYSIFGFLCMCVPTFWMLLFVRFFQGVAASGIRVIAVSIVRDLMAGRQMARIMSLVMTVFMIVPIIAPSIGQAILLFADWHWTFGVLGIAGLVFMGWVYCRLPETLPEDKRRVLSVKDFIKRYGDVLKVRQTLGYMSASGVIFGALFAFIGASEQIFDDVFHVGDRFALYFAGIAICLAAGNFMNARVVERFGMRRISHLVMLVFIVLSLLTIIAMHILGERLGLFFPLFSITFACFGLMGANFSAIAMEPQGDNAGTASAAYGFATTTIASFFGWMVASRFDGSVIPLMFGYVTLGLLALCIVLITEKGRLFEIGKGKKPFDQAS